MKLSFLGRIMLFALLVVLPSSVHAQYPRKVMSVYFSWYEANTREPINDHIDYRYANDGGRIGDYLAYHPLSCTSYDKGALDWSKRRPAKFANPALFSRSNNEFHANEFKQMSEAGIDIAMIDFWAKADAGQKPQSYWTMDRINEAIWKNIQRGAAQPNYGLFLETDAFAEAKLDLTTDAGGDRLFDIMAYVFRRIPRSHWGTIDTRPIVAFYRSHGAGLTFGAHGLKRARDRFKQEFGTDVAYVGNTAIRRLTGNQIDYTWEWGVSRRPSRVNLDNDIASLSPGYKNWKGNPTSTPPDADLYTAAWQAVRTSGKRVVWVDGWNEFHEGVAIAPTLEFGNIFSDITRRHSLKFRAGR